MAKERERTENDEAIGDEELEDARGELLPDREVMSTIDPTGTPTEGLGPPPGLFSDA